VVIGRTVTITAGGLRARQFYTLLFAVPNLSKARVSHLLGLERANSRGALRVTVRLPLVATCGPAAIYAFLPHMKVETHGSFRLIGCEASRSVQAPPPPPSGKKPKKKP
jgi:hypothetical protein